MTVETSPLQTLDDAIHTFFKDTGVLEDGAWTKRMACRPTMCAHCSNVRTAPCGSAATKA